MIPNFKNKRSLVTPYNTMESSKEKAGEKTYHDDDDGDDGAVSAGCSSNAAGSPDSSDCQRQQRLAVSLVGLDCHWRLCCC